MTPRRAVRRSADPAVLLERLRAAYGPLEPPPRRDPLDELILTILSQNTSDTNRDRAWERLQAAFTSWDQVADADVGAIESAIRSGGLAATKAPRIRAVLQAIRARRGAIDLGFLRDLPDDEVVAFCTGLPGVGPKTAACVLAFSLGRPALPVDTHVHRTTTRLGLLAIRTGAGPAHRLLHDQVAPPDRLDLHVGLIRLGRDVCRAARPRCSDCVLDDICPKVGVK